MTHAVREAIPADADDVVRLLDAAMLEFDRERARGRVDAGDVVVAIVRGYNREQRRARDNDAPGEDDRVVGACVLGRSVEAPAEIEAVAVHRSRRGRGIGTTLIGAAATRTDGPLVARFREGVRPFYESLGFAIETAEATGEDGSDGSGADRLRGVLR